jgi:preprotein translocase subunit SecF
MRIFETPTFDFLKARKVAYVISGLLFVISLIAIFTRGLQYGIDFQGGVEIVLEFDQPVAVTELRSSLGDALGTSPEIKKFGSAKDLLIRTQQGDRSINELQNMIVSAVQQRFEGNNVSVIKTDIVGPRFAEDLKAGALQAILFSMVLIFIYILIRFKNWYFSAGAVLALFHDVIIVLGVFTILSAHVPFNLQIDQAIIAAFLTIVGYSLNDTVVVFDRIRENRLVHKTMEFPEMVNKSLNDTLSRTVITSLTTLFVVLVLFIFGGEVLKGFSFALVLGVIIGTYSSLFVASSSVIELNRRAELKS